MLAVHSAPSDEMPKKTRGARRMPIYLKWRDGRPRWEPGPMLRGKGHKGRDLKDEHGRWLTLGEAVDAAAAINQLVQDGAAIALARPPERSLGALLDAVAAQPKFRDDVGEPGRRSRRLARDTRAGYLMHFRILRAWADAMPVTAIRPSDVAALYDELVQARGHVMANRCIGALGMALNFARDDLQWITHNPVKSLDRLPEEGRLVMWTPEENIAFILAADWMGFESIGDAHLVGLMTAQSRKDILAMPELDLDKDVFKLQRQKTGRFAYIPATAPLLARIEQMRKRKRTRWAGVSYRHEIISTHTGAPYPVEGSTFTDQHRQVRAVASGLQPALDQAFPLGAPVLDYSRAPFTFMPSIWDKRFHDLRDTAVTWLYDVTGDIAKVANISGHSLKTAQAIIDKHYFVRNAGMARAAGAMMDDFYKRIGFAG
jgi:hypothetical protein